MLKLLTESLAPGVIVVQLDGRLDMAGSMEIEEELLAVVTSNTMVVIDLAGVTFLASMGLRCLILAAKTVQSRSGQLALARPQPLVAEVLRASGADSLITVTTDIDSAARAVMA